MSYLLDTCVISEFVKPTPDPRTLRWLSAQREGELFISAVTVGEVYAGIERLPQGKRRDLLSVWFERDVLSRFGGRVIELDAGVFLTWGQLTGSRHKGHRTRPLLDSLIAACAIHHGLVLATRNERDFAEMGLTIVNPWQHTE